jgi:hypothetical protein
MIRRAGTGLPGTVVQEPAPVRLNEGGLPTEALVAHVAVSRYADHHPLYRQAQIIARQGGFEEQVRKLPARGPTAEAIRYPLNHWDGLARFLEDGRIELDNNSVERAMRPVALSRKRIVCSQAATKVERAGPARQRGSRPAS